MKPTNVVQYLQSVCKERKATRRSHHETSEDDGMEVEVLQRPAYLSQLLDLHKASQVEKPARGEICSTLLSLQNRKVRAISLLQEHPRKEKQNISDELIALYFPSLSTLPLGDSPRSLEVLQKLNELALKGAVPFLQSESIRCTRHKVDFKHWTAWLVASLSSIDPLCLQEADVAAQISALSRAMTIKKAKTNSQSNPLLEEEPMQLTLLSPIERELLDCINYTMMELAGMQRKDKD